MLDRKFSVYLLELEGTNLFYAGSTLTTDIQKRFQEHCDGTGSHWTNLNRPLKILEVWSNLTSREAFRKEQSLTEETITRFQNLEACRGGMWNFPPQSTWWVPKRLRHLVKHMHFSVPDEIL